MRIWVSGPTASVQWCLSCIQVITVLLLWVSGLSTWTVTLRGVSIMEPSFVFSVEHERSQSKTITSQYYKALSVQQWQEDRAFSRKTLETENEGGCFLVDEHKVHGPFRQMGGRQQGTPRESRNQQQKTSLWNINVIYLQTSYCNRQHSGRTAGRKGLALDWQPLGAEVHAHAETQTQKHTHARKCEIMTGQLLSYLSRTLRAASETWQKCLHVAVYLYSSQDFFFFALCAMKMPPSSP